MKIGIIELKIGIIPKNKDMCNWFKERCNLVEPIFNYENINNNNYRPQSSPSYTPSVSWVKSFSYPWPYWHYFENTFIFAFSVLVIVLCIFLHLQVTLRGSVHCFKNKPQHWNEDRYNRSVPILKSFWDVLFVSIFD